MAKIICPKCGKPFDRINWKGYEVPRPAPHVCKPEHK
jgi:hypothetical protein